MVDCARMESLRLRFPEHHHPEMPLGAGVHAIGRIGDTVGLVGVEDAPSIRLFVDRRGVWITVADGVRGGIAYAGGATARRCGRWCAR